MTENIVTVTKEEVEEFVKTTQFRGYQNITLPYGIIVPGDNLEKESDYLLPETLTGQSVLDIGCDYGFFCHEAKKKGAATVVGLEMNQETAKVSKEIAEIIGDGVEIVNGNVTDLANNNLEIRDNFDTILLLNVVHHLTDPIDIISKVAQLCNKMMIIEFPIPSDNKFLMRKRGYKKEGFYKNPLNKVKFKLEKGFIKLLQKRFPIIGIGGVEYHNTFYFSEKSFDNLFRLHHKSFTKIEFKKSIRKPDRVIAYCEK